MIRTLGIVMLALAIASGSAAEEKDKPPVDRTTNDRQILDTLTTIHDNGAALFDGGDPSGCYRLFQGSLQTVRILLPKDLQELIDLGLGEAARQPTMAGRAMTLHSVIEDIRKKLRSTAGPKPKSMPLGPPRPVGAGLGGPEQLPMPIPDKSPKIEPPIVPVNTPQKGAPAPVTTAPPSDDPAAPGPKLPFTPIIPKPDGK